MFVIVSDGRSDCKGAHVIGTDGTTARFDTRAEASAHRASVLDATPSKYMPLRVTPEGSALDRWRAEH